MISLKSPVMAYMYSYGDCEMYVLYKMSNNYIRSHGWGYIGYLRCSPLLTKLILVCTVVFLHYTHITLACSVKGEGAETAKMLKKIL